MKKILLGLMLFAFMNSAFADGFANLLIRVTGAVGDNRYFFCEPGIGCLSILAAQRGRVYKIPAPVHFDNAYITNLQNFRVTHQPMPYSCKRTLKPGQTIIVHGQISPAPNHNTYIAGLSCSVR